MQTRKKPKVFSLVFVAIILVSGLLLMYTGNDALVLATERKEGILTSEQVEISFDSVGGRMINEAVEEGQYVKKGDVLMVLDSTDTDLSIAQMEASIAQLEAQINSTGGNVDIAFAQADTTEQETFRQIDQQKAAVNSAQATYEQEQLDYNRMVALQSQGAVARQELDNALTALNVAEANLRREQQALNQLLAGAAYSDNTDSINLPTIAIQRQTAANQRNDVEALIQQKKGLEAQLEQLKVNKERLTLRAPEDGKILKILAKQGEMVSANTPVILLETNRYYFDVYISEEYLGDYREGDNIDVYTVVDDKTVLGNIRLISKAPGFADLKMSREKGQSDLTAFQMRIYVNPEEGIIPGMTMGVKLK